MLPPAIIREIKLLLEEGHHSRREIAERIGVSRGSVTAVAKSKRKVDDYLQQVPKIKPKPLGTPRRCPSCDAVVQMPCKLCQTRELMFRKTLPPLEPVVDMPVGLNLRPEERARYAQVRRWRREALRRGVTVAPRPDPEADPHPLEPPSIDDVQSPHDY